MLLKFNCIGVTVCTVIIIAFQLRVYRNQKMKARYLYRSPHSKTHSFSIQMFAKYPRAWCPHLVEMNALPDQGLDTSIVCEACGADRENCVCLTCFHVSGKAAKQLLSDFPLFSRCIVDAMLTSTCYVTMKRQVTRWCCHLVTSHHGAMPVTCVSTTRSEIHCTVLRFLYRPTGSDTLH